MDKFEFDINFDDVVSLDPVVTEEDVVAAFNDAEQTIASERVTRTDEVIADNEPESEIDSDDNVVLNDEIASKRLDLVQQFQMELNLDDIPDAVGMIDDETQEVSQDKLQIEPTEEEKVVESDDDPAEELDATTKTAYGCLIRILFCLLILIISCALAAVGSTFLLDVTGSTGNGEIVEVVIPAGSNTEEIAELLKDKGLINNSWYFRVYARITGADGKWQVGAFSLQSDMGFPALIETMQVAPPRKTVTVMLREGLTVEEMADILEENEVCTKESFLNAVMYGDYDYDFVRQIPTEDDNAEMAHRVYRLEGYLFPDTYEFYVGSQGETVVNRMLQNFESKISDDILQEIEARGWTLDQALTFASMVQGEGDTRENMEKVARVFYNRMSANAPSDVRYFLQLCCTRDYANFLLESGYYDKDTLYAAYNTYVRKGLADDPNKAFPIGPINNPGMDAIEAAFSPSEDKDIMKSYYFGTDQEGITHFAKTFREHQNNIDKYGIVDLG